MPIKIAICDDMAEDIELLSTALYAYDSSFEITTYARGETLLDELVDSKPLLDILFLDIFMSGIDGIMTAQKIRKERKDIKIIFVSSSKEYYPQSYDVFAFNYILKPFDREKLYSVLDRAIEEIGMERRKKISFSYKSIMYSVYTRDILFIESRDKLILYHVGEGRTLQCYGKLDDILKGLPESSFIRCHKSFIVNAFYIKEMGEDHFKVGQNVIGISRKYLKNAKDQYYTYLFSHIGRGQY